MPRHFATSAKPAICSFEHLSKLESAIVTRRKLTLIEDELNDLLTRAQVKDDRVGLAYVHHLIGLNHLVKSDYENAEDHLSKGLATAKGLELKNLIPKIQSDLVPVLAIKGEVAEAKNLALAIIEESEPGTKARLNAKMDLLHILRREGYVLEGAKFAFDLLEEAASVKDVPAQFAALTCLGLICNDIDELHLAIFYIERAADITKSSRHRHLVLDARSYLSLMYRRLGRSDHALELLRSNLDEYLRLQLYDRVFHTSLLMVQGCLTSGMISTAEHYLQLAESQGSLAQSSFHKYELLVCKGRIAIANSDFAIAVDLLTEALQHGGETGIHTADANILQMLVLSYETLERSQEALKAFRRYNDLLEANRLASAKLQESGITQSGSVIRLIEQARVESDLLETKLSATEEAVLELSTALAIKDQEVQSLWQSMWREEPQLAKHFSAQQKKSSKGRRNIKVPVHTKKQILQNPFIREVSMQFPDLTPTELHVLACTRMGLSGPEVSKALYCSERTIEHHRSNARKKLGLLAGQNLRSFLVSHFTDQPPKK